MRLRAVFLWPVVAIVIGAATFFVGRELGAGEQVVASAYDLDRPTYEAVEVKAGRSRGGFTGFREVYGPEGRTVLAGAVTAVGAGELVLETASGPVSVRLDSDRSLSGIESSDIDAMVLGATVLALISPDGEAAVALLLIEAP